MLKLFIIIFKSSFTYIIMGYIFFCTYIIKLIIKHKLKVYIDTVQSLYKIKDIHI